MANLSNSGSPSDQQVVRIPGPDGVVTTYQYNKETRSWYQRESQIVIPAFHGQTHISEDPIPNATLNLPGLMSEDDKAKLEAITQTRLGVLGFQGSGFPDDGGWMQGDIILAPGSESISLERVGNIVRFTVNNPAPLSCPEECATIYWINDESDQTSIRPPACAGRMPGVNSYGELKVYLMPESTILNSTNPLATLNTKSNYPAMVFKRYDNAITAGKAEFEAVLERNTDLTTKVGWAMTPGPLGVTEMTWFTGHDDNGEQIKFELGPNTEPGLLGSLIYNGHTLTRHPAVITNYTSNILTTNQYICKFWDIKNAEAIGDEFVATNTWKYDNPENTTTNATAPKTLALDASQDLLPVGQIIQILEFQIGEINGEKLVRRYFIKEPNLSSSTLWSKSGLVRFGHLVDARDEITSPGDTAELTAYEQDIEDYRTFERTLWGITGFEDELYLSDDHETTDTITFSGEFNQVSPSDTSFQLPNVAVLVPTLFGTVDNTLVGQSIEFSISGLSSTYRVLSNRDISIGENVPGSFVPFTNEGDDPGQPSPAPSTVNTHLIIISAIGPQELYTAVQDAGGLPQELSVFTVTDDTSPSLIPINNRYVANIDHDRPALVIEQLRPTDDRERPVYLWHRQNHNDLYVKALIGVPDDSRFPPIDILFRNPVDSYDDKYMQIISRGNISSGPLLDAPYIIVEGVGFNDLPRSGYLRTLNGLWRDRVWKYNYKMPFGSNVTSSRIMLVGNVDDPFLFDQDYDITAGGGAGTEGGSEPVVDVSGSTPDKTIVAALVHQEYSSPALRIEFSVNSGSGQESIQMQFKGGILDMNEVYELDQGLVMDNYVRGMRPGSYQVSKIYTQDGFITSGTETPDSTPSGFIAYDGGTLPAEIDGQSELWNNLELMIRSNSDDQEIIELWVWWNGLLISPDATESAALDTPTVANTPYFPITWEIPVGKLAFRLWPGAVIREIEVRDKLKSFSEYSYGQLQVNS